MHEPQRHQLMSLLTAAIAAAQPSGVLAAHLPEPLAGGRVVVVGAGKAAAAMAVASERHYRELAAQGRLVGEVATRHGYGLPTSHIKVSEAGHPVPDAGSELAARRALELVRLAGPLDTIVVLLSGGASAIWAAPVDGVTLADKQAVTRALLASGARIHDVNCVRKHLSRIKGGRLAAAAGGKRLITLAISDVPGEHTDVIGSGPTVPDPTTLADARAIIAKYGVAVPASAARALAEPRNETLKAGDPVFASAAYHIIAAPARSLAAAKASAERLGYRVELLGDALEGEARDVAKAHAALARSRPPGSRLALLSGGELTVTVRGTGAGGPNQEYALALAIALDGAPGITAIAADTDGTDGGRGAADDPAGALVFPDTLQRATARGLDPLACLENNDSTGFFRALDDVVATGPTQTNVNDFRAILIDR